MDCVPPWLSPTNQCSTNITTYNHSKHQKIEMIDTKFLAPLNDWRSTEIEEKCKNPCKKMTNKISLKVDQMISKAELQSVVQFRFKKRVRLEKKVVVYTWFNFIIDIGSSLGLWLGLSALGIADLAMGALGVAKIWLKVK